MIDLPRTRGGWRCLLVDCPWQFDDRNTRGAAEHHYPTMTNEEIALMPVEQIVARDAVMGFWVPDTHLLAGLAIVKAWGFKYRHLYPWVKVSASGKIRLGNGHYMRKAHEVAIIATRGRFTRLDAGVPSACIAPRPPRHSEKPPHLHVALERLCRGPRLELFARSPRAGWTLWGNEAPATEAAA